VAEGGAGERRRALVAGLARLARRYVTRRLAGSRRAVVTSGAARRDPGMVVGGASKSHGVPVTGFAWRLRLDM
jgi:hypothetical protein